MVEYLTVKEVADLLRIKERKVYDLASKGVLPCSKAIGKLLFPHDQIIEWVGSHSDFATIDLNIVRPNVFLGSHDPLLDWAIQESLCGLATLFDSSRDGLERFKNREGIATGLHLPNLVDADWNLEAISSHFTSEPVVLVSWAKRTRGIALADGIKLPDQSLSGLMGLKIIPRQAGAGTQVFLEKLLKQSEVNLSDLTILEPARSEQDLVQNIASGTADAGFALESIAKSYKLNFVPIAHEHFDLLIDRRSWFEPPFQKLLAFCQTDRFSRKAIEFGGYDLTGNGKVLFNGK